MNMMDCYGKIEAFLKAPEDMMDAFWEGSALIWVDWREYDDAIIDYVNEYLPPEARIEYEVRDCAAPRGVNIVLKKDGVCAAIPYPPDRMDRDMTLRAVQAHLEPVYRLRLFTGSLGCDTLAFCLLPEGQWQRLEAAFGTGYVARHFQPVGPDSVLFGP